jgi:hypothetical protein
MLLNKLKKNTNTTTPTELLALFYNNAFVFARNERYDSEELNIESGGKCVCLQCNLG